MGLRSSRGVWRCAPAENLKTYTPHIRGNSLSCMKIKGKIGLHSFTGPRTQVHRTTCLGQNGVLYENRQVVFHHIIYHFCIAARQLIQFKLRALLRVEATPLSMSLRGSFPVTILREGDGRGVSDTSKSYFWKFLF